MSSMAGGKGCPRAASTRLAAKRAAAVKSKSWRVTREKAMAGTPSIDASMAAATVPE